jgi:hypothetical protein
MVVLLTVLPNRKNCWACDVQFQSSEVQADYLVTFQSWRSISLPVTNCHSTPVMFQSQYSHLKIVQISWNAQPKLEATWQHWILAVAFWPVKPRGLALRHRNESVFSVLLLRRISERSILILSHYLRLGVSSCVKCGRFPD